MIARLRNLLGLPTPPPPQRLSRPRAWPPVVSAATSPLTTSRNYFGALNTVDEEVAILDLEVVPRRGGRDTWLSLAGEAVEMSVMPGHTT